VTATAESGRCQPRPDSRSTVISADELAGRPRHPGSPGRRGKSGLHRAGWLPTAIRG